VDKDGLEAGKAVISMMHNFACPSALRPLDWTTEPLSALMLVKVHF
jgi:hypothetical protein